MGKAKELRKAVGDILRVLDEYEHRQATGVVVFDATEPTPKPRERFVRRKQGN